MKGLERTFDQLMHGPLTPLITGTIGVTLYWVLRVRATNSASYRLLADELGEPGRIERLLVGGFVLSLYVLLAYRGFVVLAGGVS